ncbi:MULTISPECIES: hypothetical protein [unclassified Streptomyces]|uniref:hypothetical protein n=1 Tax=unclassified Streptomyces TaxID=2593676 RepID=UPI002E1058BD|nr:hypothetical protein OG452_24930 [Streptomyces sp. NBC_01197]WSS49003.1 hypothetical protein OG708_10315 [Streptomyces sp. NBC_01180]
MRDEIADQVWDAVDHWVEGRHEESVQILATLAQTQTPSMMYGVACGIATVARAALTKMHGHQSHDCFWGIKTPDGSRPEDRVPPHHLFAARFIAANLNNDKDTALALYKAACASDAPELWPACMHMLLAATGEAVLAATAGGDR